MIKRILTNKRNYILFFVAVLLVSTVLKFLEVINNNFPFTMDQGRDMVDLRHMVVTYSPRLVGPTTSINGVLLGPFWYYFNLIPFILGGGNPSIIVYWQIFWYQVSVVILWLVLRKKNTSLATIISTLLLLTPTSFNTARYFWNANSMPLFTVLFFSSLIATIHDKNKKNLLLLGLISGLSMQVEAAFGILFFPFALIYLLLDRIGFKKSLYLIIGFAVTLLPQVLFELKHDFIMTKVFINEFSGKGDMLGEKIGIAERFTQRWEHLRDLIMHATHLPPNYVPTLFALSLTVFLFMVLWKKSLSKNMKIWSLSFYFILFSGIFYILFPQKLKLWYTLGLSVPLVIFFGSFLNYLFESKIKILKLFSLIVIIMAVYYSTKSQSDYTRYVASKPSDDRSNLRNELAAIDWVYQNAQGRGFKVYSYLPSVYDFPYNHLFWWYGNKAYGYQPFETAYLPNQPEYIRDVDKLWKNKKELDSKELTFLIIEEDFDMPIRTERWLGNFSNLCVIKEETFPWHAQVRMLEKCSK